MDTPRPSVDTAGLRTFREEQASKSQASEVVLMMCVQRPSWRKVTMAGAPRTPCTLLSGRLEYAQPDFRGYSGLGEAAGPQADRGPDASAPP